MKNILLISELYPLPSPENKSTSVCHYFTREWAARGYNVVAIHFQPVHCRLWHIFIKLFGRWISNRLGGIYYSRRINGVEAYVMEGVPVYRIPIYIPIPHGRFSPGSMSSFINTCRKTLDSISFVPDVITGHMLPPEVIPMLNEKYSAGTCMVCHGVSPKEKARYDDMYSLLSYYDLWGYRSLPIKKDFQKIYGYCPERSFICHSGIPSEFISDIPHVFHHPVNSFLYVGDLIGRKHPDALLKAVPAAAESGFSIVYVGDGPEKKSLEESISRLGLTSEVEFTGPLDRKCIIEHYDKSDCFIMISHNEAFGLVYIEAMARGCITIASRHEGMDGVIIDGWNGFLCEAGDADELSSIITGIKSLSEDKISEISRNAVATAAGMTDSAVAEEYLKQLESLSR